MSNTSKTWYGFDLDRTLARYDKWKGVEHIGEPILSMVEKVKQYLAEGRRIKIFTARVYYDKHAVTNDEDMSILELRAIANNPSKDTFANPPEVKCWAEAMLARRAIQRWCMEHLGTPIDEPIEVTCEKDPWCLELWDDIAKPVLPNEGISFSFRMLDLLKHTYTVVSTRTDDESVACDQVEADSAAHAMALVGDKYGDERQVILVFDGSFAPKLMFDLAGN